MSNLSKYQEQLDEVAPGRTRLLEVVSMGGKSYRKKARFVDLTTGEEVEYGNINKLVCILKKDPGYLFRTPSTKHIVIDIPNRDEIVSTYQDRADKAVPGGYTVLSLLENRVRLDSKSKTPTTKQRRL